jgi:dCTP diphosphatase
MSDQNTTVAELRELVQQFVEARDWRQFHAPKNLSMSLAIEAAELMEHFQWLSEDASRRLPEADRARVREELADVLLYLVRLADELGVDLAAAARDKIEINARKYPVDKARGTSRKATDL